MEIIIALAAFGASLLTLFSGFGLGTLLMPVFGLFFPVQVAVALTGVVHLLNNVFKMTLLGKNAVRDIIIRFGIPSLIGGLGGAALLAQMSETPPIASWACCGKTFDITLMKLVIAGLMIFFSLMEWVPALKNLQFAQRYLSTGGLLSGFFGGLSGHQGALRSAFLSKMGLEKTQFVATGVIVACMVDAARLPVYFWRFRAAELWQQWPLLLIATLSAFAGAYFGANFLKKVTLAFVQTLTAIMIFAIAICLALGIV